MKRVLMIGYHFPPIQGSSGVQRMLKFARYLPENGWEPIVVTAHPRAYASVNDGQMRDIPPDLIVKRAFALDTARHLAVRGSYPARLALPDRWVTWWLGAVPTALWLIRRYRPRVLWSTFPIATAHLIGRTLQRLTKLPWVADFRDSMTEEGFPEDLRVRRTYVAIERATVERCTAAVFTTHGAARIYRERYPALPVQRWRIIENGYDEENFRNAELGGAQKHREDGKLVLVHSGLLYPSERNPEPFFQAVATLKRAGDISERTFAMILRGTGHDDAYRGTLRSLNIEDIVHLAPVLPYEQALAEMLTADGLVLFQAANCNHQVPAKIYEYLRARRPILGLTDATGDTAGVLRAVGVDSIYPLDRSDAIVAGLRQFIHDVRKRCAPVANAASVAASTRRARAGELSGLLDAVSSESYRVS